MTRQAETKQADPDEGSRENVNVPIQNRQADRGRPETGQAERSAPTGASKNRDEQAHVPPREESREPSNTHRPRRDSM